MIIGSKIIHLPSVDSTNNYVANQLKTGGLRSGTVILADEQSAGRGQRGATWTSNPGENLLFSSVYRPDNMSVSDQFLVSQVSALAVSDFLRKIGISAMVKWPNDIVVSDQKIAGILVECTLSGNKVNEFIIGIGLNVNQLHFDELRATSVQLKSGLYYNIHEVLFGVINELNGWLTRLENNEYDYIRSNYLSQLIGFKVTRTYAADGQRFEGQIIGIDNWGKVIMEIGEETKTFDLKEISFCW